MAAVVVAGGFTWTSAVQQQAPAPLPAPAHRTLVKRYCITCHSDRLKTGGLTLEPVASGVAFLKKPSVLLETARQPYRARFNSYRHPHRPCWRVPTFCSASSRTRPAFRRIRHIRISDLGLASRLSFFLWSSIPDDELLDLAAAGKLHKPPVLERQVRRMLADARSHALVADFASRWLPLRNLASGTPDMRLFPDFDDNLRQAFRKETEPFFESVVREDRSALDLLCANYTFLNERLAKHYGIPHVYGSRFRRVTLDGDTGRGGLLRQASILTVTSYATRTSPVIRGKWVLENMLGVPPSPPLPNVPALKDNTVDGNLSVRRRLAEHRSNPTCAACHNLMDPVGLSLEKFDAVGRRRDREAGIPIDALGGLPDGSQFADVHGLEQALLRRPEIFVGTFAEKLFTYALGRGVEYYDAPAIRAIVREARSQDYRVSSLIMGIVKSKPFQMRKSP